MPTHFVLLLLYIIFLNTIDLFIIFFLFGFVYFYKINMRANFSFLYNPKSENKILISFHFIFSCSSAKLVSFLSTPFELIKHKIQFFLNTFSILINSYSDLTFPLLLKTNKYVSTDALCIGYLSVPSLNLNVFFFICSFFFCWLFQLND